MFLDSGRCFGFWDVFWILGSVLDSGKCFVPTSHRRKASLGAPVSVVEPTVLFLN